MQLEQDLRNVLQKAFQCIYHLELDPQTFNIQMTNKAFLGHFSLPMFSYVKLCHDPCQVVGAADLRYADYSIDKMIYVVGDEQTYLFKVLFSILGRLNRSYAPNMYHLPYGMVNLPSGKMKSRQGKVVDADTLIDEMADSVNTYIHTNEDKLAGMTEQERHKLSQILMFTPKLSFTNILVSMVITQYLFEHETSYVMI